MTKEELLRDIAESYTGDDLPGFTDKLKALGNSYVDKADFDSLEQKYKRLSSEFITRQFGPQVPTETPTAEEVEEMDSEDSVNETDDIDTENHEEDKKESRLTMEEYLKEDAENYENEDESEDE